MKHLAAFATAAALMATTSASAQSSAVGDGFYINGYVEFGYFDDGGTDDTFLRGDMDLGYAPAAGGLGFSLGIDGFAGSINDEVAFYPALEYSTEIGKFSIGVPRSVLDRGYMPEPKFGNNSYLDLEFRGVLASSSGLAYLVQDVDMYGMRYDGEFGNTKVGFSAHNLKDSSGSVNSFALVASHSLETSGLLGTVQLYGGIEHLRGSGLSETNYRVGAEAVNGRTTGGLTYAHENAIFGVDVVMGYVDYEVMDNLTLTGSLASIKPSGSASRTAYGLGVEYGFANNAYIKASYVDGTSSSIDPIYEIMVGWEF